MFASACTQLLHHHLSKELSKTLTEQTNIARSKLTAKRFFPLFLGYLLLHLFRFICPIFIFSLFQNKRLSFFLKLFNLNFSPDVFKSTKFKSFTLLNFVSSQKRTSKLKRREYVSAQRERRKSREKQKWWPMLLSLIVELNWKFVTNVQIIFQLLKEKGRKVYV